jgi:hypothetical protein
MAEIFIMAIAAAAGALFLILKFGSMRKVLAFDVPIDIAFTGLLMWSMAGTYTGIMTAIMAGAILSAVLFALKKTYPPDSLTPKGWKPSPDRSWIDRLKQI